MTLARNLYFPAVLAGLASLTFAGASTALQELGAARTADWAAPLPQPAGGGPYAPGAGAEFDTEVRYRIVGVYEGPTIVSAEAPGVAVADVADRVEIDLTWHRPEGRLVGTPSLRNLDSTAANPRHGQPDCATPALNGRYEHATVTHVQGGPAGAIELVYETAHPDVAVPRSCRGVPTAVAARHVSRRLEVLVPAPTLLAPHVRYGAVRVTGDGRSFVLDRGDGWTWTLTPIPR